LQALPDGEGTSLKGPPSRPGYPIVAVEMTDEDVVGRVAGLWGCSYQAVSPRKSHHKGSYRVRLTGSSAVAVMQAVYPLLGKRRQGQINAALASYIRRPVGGQNKKITAAQAIAIRRRRSDGESTQLIADDYGISKWNVYAIAQGRSWANAS